VPHDDAPVPRPRGEPDGGGARRGPQGEGDRQGAGQAAGSQPRRAGGVHRRQARGLHGQGHVASSQWKSFPVAAQCRRALGLTPTCTLEKIIYVAICPETRESVDRVPSAGLFSAV
jgi:hypothetical protein